MLFNKCTSCGCGSILNKLLLCMPNVKLPIGKGHYVTPCNISLFSNLACVENSLSCLTKNICKGSIYTRSTVPKLCNNCPKSDNLSPK